MYCASDADPSLLAQIPDLILIPHSSSHLSFSLNEWVRLFHVYLLVILICLVEDRVVDSGGLEHDLSDAIHSLVIQSLLLVGSLIHSEQVQHVGLISLVNKQFVLILLDDDIPRVHRLGSSHDSSNCNLSGEDVCNIILGQSGKYGVLKSLHIKDLSCKGNHFLLLVSTCLIKVLVVMMDLSTCGHNFDLGNWDGSEFLEDSLVDFRYDGPVALDLD